MAKEPTGRDSWSLDGQPEITPDMPIKSLMDRSPFKLSEDRKGHDTSLGAKLPKSYDRWVAKFREMNGSPYELKSDIVRDALTLGLIILSMRYSLDPDWQIEAKLALEKSKTQDILRIQTEVAEMSKNLESLNHNGNPDLAKKELVKYVDLIDNLSTEKKKTYFRALNKELRKADIEFMMKGIKNVDPV